MKQDTPTFIDRCLNFQQAKVLYQQPFEKYSIEIVRLHEVLMSITSDRDPKFYQDFGGSFSKKLDMRLDFSKAFHPRRTGKSERTIKRLRIQPEL